MAAKTSAVTTRAGAMTEEEGAGDGVQPHEAQIASATAPKIAARLMMTASRREGCSSASTGASTSQATAGEKTPPERKAAAVTAMTRESAETRRAASSRPLREARSAAPIGAIKPRKSASSK